MQRIRCRGEDGDLRSHSHSHLHWRCSKSSLEQFNTRESQNFGYGCLNIVLIRAKLRPIPQSFIELCSYHEDKGSSQDTLV